jgi:AbrB family looped-hinge helix DNA binding protein
METTKLSSKGQIVLPRSIRNARNLQPGTEFSVEETAEGILLRPLKPFARTSTDQVFGSLRYAGKAKTVAQMHEAVLAEARRRR